MKKLLAAAAAAALAVGALVAAPAAANAAITSPEPGVQANFEAATVSHINQVSVRGWASVWAQDYQRVSVYMDGKRVALVLTGSWRPDVGAYVHNDGTTNFYGWKASFTASPGTHTIRAYVITPDGSNPLFGTKTITVPTSPIYHVDSVTAVCPAAGSTAPRIKIVGWDFDPDDLGAVGFVDVYKTMASGATTSFRQSNSVDRPDVRKAYDLKTNGAGFSVVTPIAGVKTVRIYAINSAGAGSNPLMKTIDVASLAKPTCPPTAP